ncbi:EGF-like domain, extracellular [Phytophthora cactorum]|nr:EGF-like domain, extracellular [Phytophthora cactorum]
MRRLPLAVGALLLVCDTADAACARGVHNSKICSGHGTCNTRNLCECDAKHFGFDCSQKRCPLGPAWVAPARATDDAHYLVECSNKGVCDHEEGKCTCDEGFIGSACQRSTLWSLKSCPRGDDPMTNGQKNEVQIVQCTGTGGSTEAEIPFDATLNDLEKILTTIKTLPVVKVAFGGTAITVCSSTTANPIMIEFIQDFGP